jgi:hypothetical protein
MSTFPTPPYPKHRPAYSEPPPPYSSESPPPYPKHRPAYSASGFPPAYSESRYRPAYSEPPPPYSQESSS